MRTSSHHQPEAQHPKSPAIYTPAGRLPHLWVTCGRRHGKNFLTFLQYWSGAVTCPAC